MRAMKIKAIRGTKDVLPKEAEIWRAIEEKAKSLCEVYGYRQIRTPVLEEAGLFTRSIGKASDIVRKEMYSFLDRKKRLLCLRPEATASVARAYLEHGLDADLTLAKLYYLGPMFRAERPQAGRLRQFHHIGVEAIGSSSPYLDSEIISLAARIIEEIGIRDFTIHLNSIGCQKDRSKYYLQLKVALKGKLKYLCPDCHSRFKKNPLRIFDCKNTDCRKIIRFLPAIEQYMCDECHQHYAVVDHILRHTLKIKCVHSPHLVRGLDYYTKTCFEITHPRLGAQDAIGAGGRYDNLIKELGGADKPAIGFALGIERLIAAIEPSNIESSESNTPCVYIATIGGKEVKEEAAKALDLLRRKNIPAEIDYLDKSLKAQMRGADKLGAKYVAILGEEELKKQVVILRNMQEKSQKEVSLDKLAEELK